MIASNGTGPPPVAMDMREETKFTVTADHIKLAKLMYVGWQDCEYGAPEIDPKRPYGNSDVELDIAEALGWRVGEDNELTREQQSAAAKIHAEMQTVLQILLQQSDLLKVPATFERPSAYTIEWRATK